MKSLQNLQYQWRSQKFVSEREVQAGCYYLGSYGNWHIDIPCTFFDKNGGSDPASQYLAPPLPATFLATQLNSIQRKKVAGVRLKKTASTDDRYNVLNECKEETITASNISATA